MKQKSVLIVEDETPLARALELKLQHEGCSVDVASNGQEALDLIAKNKYDVVLLDLVMPLVDGFQVLEKIHKLSTPPAVFVLSNLSQPEDEARASSLGARKFFVKSNTPLAAIVDEIKNT